MSAARALVIVPTYNERENLPIVAAGLMAHPNVRLLVVDDQSPDGTGGLAEELKRQYQGRVEVMHRTGRRGLGRSYVDGFRMALESDADVICQMDADLVLGSRYVPGGKIVNWPLRRQILSRFANSYVRLVTRMKARDCTTGFRCWRRSALAKLPLDRISSDGYSFLVETLFMAARGGARFAEVPITFVERRQGVSKMSREVLVESVLMPWRLVGRHRV